MQYDITSRAAAVFVCHSSLDLQAACYHLQIQYNLPAFRFDDHGSWKYGHSVGKQIGFNVTKTQRLDTIARWMNGVPENVNYQIILFLAQTDTSDAEATSGARATVEEVDTFLRGLFTTNVLRVGHQ